MCRYLIQHGADIDHLGGLPFEAGIDGTALLAGSFSYYDTRNDSHYQSKLECQRLLLDAGSDPTIPYTAIYYPVENYLQGLMQRGDPVG